MLVVIGPGSAESLGRDGRRRLDSPTDVVRREISSALNQGIVVVPVLVNGASMPSEGVLPENMAALATRNAFRVHDDSVGGAHPWRLNPPPVAR